MCKLLLHLFACCHAFARMVGDLVNSFKNRRILWCGRVITFINRGMPMRVRLGPVFLEPRDMCGRDANKPQRGNEKLRDEHVRLCCFTAANGKCTYVTIHNTI